MKKKRQRQKDNTKIQFELIISSEKLPAYSFSRPFRYGFSLEDINAFAHRLKLVEINLNLTPGVTIKKEKKQIRKNNDEIIQGLGPFNLTLSLAAYLPLSRFYLVLLTPYLMKTF